MRNFVRPVATALGIAGVAVAISLTATGGALAQAKQQQMAPPAKQQAAPPPQAAPPRDQADRADGKADRGRAGGTKGYGRDHRQAAR